MDAVLNVFSEHVTRTGGGMSVEVTGNIHAAAISDER